MQNRRHPIVVWLRFFASSTICFVGLTGCATGNGALQDGPPHISAGKVAVMIESSPAAALITANGSLKGSTPVSIEVEVDDLGDVAVEVDLTASFADSMGLKDSPPPEPASYRIVRGERAPSVVRFDTDGAVAH
ncbi:MAG TPA: hypothetical protein VHD62_09735 [Opitutaceae bacterium]|nr:hypothetical protein [Opitutaceae bacterium]